MSLTTLEPVPRLLSRVRAELAAAFDCARPIRISRAPGRLDVMGGIAEYTGSIVCQATLDRAVAVALQPRADRLLQIFSFNLLDENLPFTFNISIDHLAEAFNLSRQRGAARLVAGSSSARSLLGGLIRRASAEPGDLSPGLRRTDHMSGSRCPRT